MFTATHELYFATVHDCIVGYGGGKHGAKSAKFCPLSSSPPSCKSTIICKIENFEHHHQLQRLCFLQERNKGKGKYSGRSFTGLFESKGDLLSQISILL